MKVSLQDANGQLTMQSPGDSYHFVVLIFIKL